MTWWTTALAVLLAVVMLCSGLYLVGLFFSVLLS
jgi:hypothetical protein